MTKLSVNLNKVALLRNARSLDIPSVIRAGQTCINTGAYGITVHPRPDERHIRYSDVYELKDIVKSVEFNIEGNPFTGRFMELMPDILPTQATLVPDSPDQNTSDHGWKINDENRIPLAEVIKKLKALGIRVSLFVDPDESDVKAAAEIGADRVELYTEPYAGAFSRQGRPDEMVAKYAAAAKVAEQIGLGVNAGHDLNLDNLTFFCDNVKPVMEVSIGHALIADALNMGMVAAVKAYLEILKKVKN
ncbi:MAG: pyridoxine 5'-phosphate synthase [Anaerohalosphaeraceae bacterium]|nr:pyridoxine 5'-phosphate synthase [Anaerohalosphaeraceae bacterium]